MKMLFCLLIAAIIGAFIGYLIGRMIKCDNKDEQESLKPFGDGVEGLPKHRFIESKAQEVEVENVDDKDLLDVTEENDTLLNIVKEESGLNGDEEKPELLTEAKDGKADDLKEISGVGLKLEKVLNDLGVYHFAQIASWSEKELNWIDNHLVAFKGRAKREKWVEQAKVLAEGGMTEFSKRVKKGEIDRY
jgi:predicted flap endonuclease-1-like 5' DNA nuclease